MITLYRVSYGRSVIRFALREDDAKKIQNEINKKLLKVMPHADHFDFIEVERVEYSIDDIIKIFNAADDMAKFGMRIGSRRKNFLRSIEKIGLQEYAENVKYLLLPMGPDE